MIVPFIYYKASEVVAEDRSDCEWEFKVDVQFDFEDEYKSYLIEDLYKIMYHPFDQYLDLWGFYDYNVEEDGDIFLINRYLERYRPFKLKISTHATCFIEPDSSDDEDEPPNPIEESFETDNCIICLDKEPNILFTDCNHICVCLECAKIKSLANCPYCRNEISRRIKIYGSIIYLLYKSNSIKIDT